MLCVTLRAVPDESALWRSTVHNTDRRLNTGAPNRYWRHVMARHLFKNVNALKAEVAKAVQEAGQPAHGLRPGSGEGG